MGQLNIFIANSSELIASNLKNEKIDLIIVGAGLPDESKDQMVQQVKKITPNIPVHIMEKIPGITPASMIGYTNEKAKDAMTKYPDRFWPFGFIGLKEDHPEEKVKELKEYIEKA